VSIVHCDVTVSVVHCDVTVSVVHCDVTVSVVHCDVTVSIVHCDVTVSIVHYQNRKLSCSRLNFHFAQSHVAIFLTILPYMTSHTGTVLKIILRCLWNKMDLILIFVNGVKIRNHS